MGNCAATEGSTRRGAAVPGGHLGKCYGSVQVPGCAPEVSDRVRGRGGPLRSLSLAWAVADLRQAISALSPNVTSVHPSRRTHCRDQLPPVRNAGVIGASVTINDFVSSAPEARAGRRVRHGG